MPELKLSRETKKVILPKSTKEAGEECWVEVFTDLRAEDMMAMGQYAKQPEKAGVGTFVRVIKEWNFTINGEPAPIVYENVAALPGADLLAIIEATDLNASVGGLDDAKKKQ